MAGVVHDIRLALRGMVRSPGFSLAALFTLALGIGGTATIFTLFDQVLVRPLPYPDSDELVELWEKTATFENAMVSYPNFLDWQARNRVFQDIAVWNDETMNLTGTGDPTEVVAALVSASVFPLLGVRPAFGRTFSSDEDRVGGAPVAVLGHSFWQRRFGGDSDAVGQSLFLDGVAYTVIGVMPEDFLYPPRMRRVDLYVPVGQFAGNWIEQRGNHPGLLGLARLSPGVTLEEARQDLDRVAFQLEAEYPDTNEGSRVHVASFQERVTRNARDTILLLLVSVGLLFLIACINVANLILARTTGRYQEMAVRASLGAGTRRIVRLLLTETMILWIVGGSLGLLLAWGGVALLPALLADTLPAVFRLRLDVRVASVALALTLFTGLIFGLPPALRVARKNLRGFLKDGRRVYGGVGRSRFRSGLVVAEVSLAVALLAAAGLSLRSLANVLGTPTGLDPSDVLSVELNLPSTRYAEPEERTLFFTRLLDEVRALPGVRSAATAYNVPLAPGGWQNAFHVEGEPPEVGGQGAYAEASSVSTGYFTTLGIPLSRGRDFTRDDNADSPPVLVVDEGTAARYWPNEDPIGKRLKWGNFGSDSPWMEVVGVVGQVKTSGVTQRALPQMYIPHWQDNRQGYYLLVKAERNPLALVEPVRRIVLGLDPHQPLADVTTMEAYVRGETRGDRLLALLTAIFSVSALLLAAVGIYGVMAQMVSERRHEIGVRVALGARSEQVLRLVLRQGLTRVGLGVLLGVGLGLGLGRIMAAQLFGVSPADPLTFLLTSAVVATTAMLANLLPARRMTRTDPMKALTRE